MIRILTIVFFLIQSTIFSNMAEPVVHGTLGSRPFLSEFVDVVHEELFIKIDKKFEYALFDIKYHINATKDGIQIPFLFYASEYLNAFSIKIDGQEVLLNEIPDEFKIPEQTKFKDFTYLFENEHNKENNTVIIEDSLNGSFHIQFSDLLFFETDITKGEHIIEVSYRATSWIDSWDWVNEYSFRYALSPAKYWKSFGSIVISLDATEFTAPVNTNLGEPTFGKIDSIAVWEFNKLPVEILLINFNPDISQTAKDLIAIGPSGLAYITGGILAIIHIVFLILYRRRFPLKKYSIVVIVGCLLLPLIFLICWINYYDTIDSYIGSHAAKSHGYNFLIIILYPFITPVYFLICWLIDKLVKRKFWEYPTNQ
jgi:hypothetical protein